MKKQLLLFSMAAFALGAQAETALILCDGAQAFNPPTADQVIILPIGWDCKNDGASIVTNAGELKFASPTSWQCRNSAIRWGKNKAATLTATEGCTITKITTYSQDKTTNTLFGSETDGWALSTTDVRMQTYTPAEGKTSVKMQNASGQNRLNWMLIEYTGTATQVYPAILENQKLAAISGEALKVTTATPGATIHYTLDGTVPTTDSPVASNGEIVLTADAFVKTLAVADGMKASYVYQQPVMVGKAGSRIAEILYPQMETVKYLKDGALTTPTIEANFTEPDNSNNQWWDLGPNPIADDYANVPTTVFVSDDAKMTFYGAKGTSPRYFHSATFGGNNEVRGYQGTMMTFEAPKGKIITDVIFNGADLAELKTGYATIVTTTTDDKTTKSWSFEGTTDQPGQGTLTASAIYSKWSYHYTAPEEGTYKAQIICTKDATMYIDNFFICYAEDPAGIDEIAIDEENNAPAVYYNLQGVKVENPTHGLYIKHQGNKATKVIL